MSVLILNLTDNQNEFEDKFCENIKASIINKDVQVIAKRGFELTQTTDIIDGYKIVVVVAHANNKAQNSTILNIGFNLVENIPEPISAMLNSPTILTQILGKNTVKYILIFCACKALSAEVLESVWSDDNCIGTISSKNDINKNEYRNVAEIINYLQNKMDSEEMQKADIDSILSKVNMPGLFYYENNMKIIERSE